MKRIHRLFADARFEPFHCTTDAVANHTWQRSVRTNRVLP